MTKQDGWVEVVNFAIETLQTLLGKTVLENDFTHEGIRAF
jgi:hypothetical protein